MLGQVSSSVSGEDFAIFSRYIQKRLYCRNLQALKMTVVEYDWIFKACRLSTKEIKVRSSLESRLMVSILVADGMLADGHCEDAG